MKTFSLKRAILRIIKWMQAPKVESTSGDTYITVERTDTSVKVGMGVGSSGTNHGIWSWALNKWLVYGDSAEVYVNGVKVYAPKILWSGSAVMNENQAISTTGATGYVLSERLDAQAHGIILAWSAYSSGSAQNYNWSYDFVPVTHVKNHSGAGVGFTMMTEGVGTVGSKYLYISTTSITGHAKNDDTGTSRGITYNNAYWVLREVIGV